MGESRRLSIRPSTPRARDSPRRPASSSQRQGRRRVGDVRSTPSGRRRARAATSAVAALVRAARSRCRCQSCLEDVVGHEHDRDRRAPSGRPASAGRSAAAAPRTAAAGRRGRRAPRRRAPCPSGRRDAAAAISGKRWVISSSPRDQRCTAPPRRTSCARMPSHFHSISQSDGVAERRRIVLERRREEERVGPRLVDRPMARATAATRTTRRSGSTRPSAAPRWPWCRVRRLGQRADHERLRHADAQLAGEQLEQDEALQPVELAPPVGHARAAAPPDRGSAAAGSARRATGQRAAASGSPGLGRRQLIEHQRRGLGAVADDRVALLEQPGRRGRSPASVQSWIAAYGTRRFRRRPVRKKTAHAASAGGAAPKYRAIAATLALVEVVRSIASKARSRAGI